MTRAQQSFRAHRDRRRANIRKAKAKYRDGQGRRRKTLRDLGIKGGFLK